ncbi:N-6 DNA methylase [Pseudomonas sp. NMI760_13]|uniref:N-6 DNA methylase n=1 Tax=Pseudomonas sp. NMI760_13 TaxID=2903147 RepID=UPI001E5E08D0|nr:N-6 DNA methylase [Pseudomonas sp. NMI760_13]MCE0917335.1 SAM-dependent methyltransferase [Pseudomonas sp. NMI760_13]
MNNSDHPYINAIISELRANTGLDTQELRDFVISVFFVYFVALRPHNHDRRADLVRPILIHGEASMAGSLLHAAETIDHAYNNELGLLDSIKPLLSRLEKNFTQPLVDACLKLHYLVLSIETAGSGGQHFEQIIQNFSEVLGKRADEAYTPREVVDMMVGIVEPNAGESVYDPTCGSGGFLISAHIKALENNNSEPVKIYGRDINISATRIAKINCIVHGILDSDISLSDSLRTVEDSTYDIVLANPPFSMTVGTYTPKDSFSYFDFGSPPANNADYAFIQMIIKSLKPGGRAAVLVSHGVLFRGGAEGDIRANIVRAGIIDSIIYLPPGLLKNTAIPTAILVLRKSATSRNSILLIDATEARKHNNLNLSNPINSALKPALDLYKSRENLDGISKVVTLEEIEKNDYNLNSARYLTKQDAQRESLEELTRKQLELEVNLANLQIEFKKLLDSNTAP